MDSKWTLENFETSEQFELSEFDNFEATSLLIIYEST